MKAVYAVIIVNFNSGDHLAAAVASVAEDAAGDAWEAVVVDNASSDGSDQVTWAPALPVRVLRNRENVGFARAVNQALAETSADLVLVLNPDCRLLPGALAMLKGELERVPRCGVAGPRVLDPDGSVQGSARGDPNMLSGLFGRSTMLGRLFPGSPVARRNVRVPRNLSPQAESFEVDWVSGACLLARRTALEAANGFAERYFLYWEDADLCRRLRSLGYSIRYVPEARVVHNVGASRRAAPALAIRAFHESAYTYYVTHVVRSRFHPSRWLAWIILRVRCLWHLWRAAGRARRALKRHP